MDISGITSAIFELKPLKIISDGFHGLVSAGASTGTGAIDSTESVLTTVNDISGVGTIVDATA